jgi:hypothetical protein
MVSQNEHVQGWIQARVRRVAISESEHEQMEYEHRHAKSIVVESSVLPSKSGLPPLQLRSRQIHRNNRRLRESNPSEGVVVQHHVRLGGWNEGRVPERRVIVGLGLGPHGRMPECIAWTTQGRSLVDRAV